MPNVFAACGSGTITKSQNGKVLRCAAGWKEVDKNYEVPETETGTLIVYEQLPPFDPATVDPIIATLLFTGGWSICFAPFLMAWSYKAIMRVFGI